MTYIAEIREQDAHWKIERGEATFVSFSNYGFYIIDTEQYLGARTVAEWRLRNRCPYDFFSRPVSKTDDVIQCADVGYTVYSRTNEQKIWHFNGPVEKIRPSKAAKFSEMTELDQVRGGSIVSFPVK